MKLLNFWMFFISFSAIIMQNVSAVIWGIHGFPYTKEPDREKGKLRRTFKEGGGRWQIIAKGYIPYDRSEGNKLKNTKSIPLKGFLIGGGLTCLLFLGVFVILIVLTLVYPSFENFGVWLYCIAIFLILTFIFPDLFVKFSNLPGRVIEFPEDAPYSLMFWGVLVSFYASSVLLKRTQTYDIMTELIDKFLPAILGHKVGILGVPFIGLGLIVGLSKLFFSEKMPHFAVWSIFYCSWSISLVTCIIFGLLLL